MISTSLPLPVLHLGLPKTATALLQREVFAKHSGLCFFGKCVGAENMWFTRENERFVEQLSNYARPESLKGLHRTGQSMLAEAREQGRIPLWSKEEWSAAPLKRRFRTARNFRAALGRCRIILVLRQPHDFVESLYFQKLMAAQLGFDDRVGKPGRYFTLEHWLDINWNLHAHGDLSNLDYARTAEIYARIFGADALGIFLYEDLQEDSDTYARTLAAFIDIDGDEMKAHLGKKYAHVRVAEEQVDRIRHIDASSWHRLLFHLRSLPARRRLLGMGGFYPRPDQGPRARAVLPKRWVARIAELTAPGNRWLMERWGVDLERHEYPL